MKSYFDEQMQLLEKDALLFAKKYPEHARHLNLESLDDRDPNIERLLEGFAYLTAQIKQSLDENTNSITETFLETLYPDCLKPMPSKLIGQFSYDPQNPNNKKEYLTVENSLQSSPVGDENCVCQFKAGSPHSIHPLIIRNIVQKKAKESGYELTLHLTSIGAFELSNDVLNLYFNGEYDQRLSWIYALLNQCTKSEIFYQAQTTKISIRHSIFDECKLSQDDPFGTELIKDYFTFRDKFMFVELYDLPNINVERDNEILLKFYLKQPIEKDYLQSHQAVMLGCVPMINQFEFFAEPVNYQPDRDTFPLILDSEKRNSIYLQEVLGIESLLSREQKIAYSPFHAYQDSDSGNIIYRLHRQQADIATHKLSLSGKYSSLPQRLTIKTFASNGYYPRKFLSIGMTELDAGDNKHLTIQGTNLSRPTKYYPSIHNSQYYWCLIGKLSQNYKSFSEPKNLRQALFEHDLSGKSTKKIEAINQVNITPKQMFRKGALAYGVVYTIQIDEHAFLSNKEIYLFGMMLHFYILHHVQMNHFLETHIDGLHDELNYQWLSNKGKLLKC